MQAGALHTPIVLLLHARRSSNGVPCARDNELSARRDKSAAGDVWGCGERVFVVAGKMSRAR